MTDTVVVEPSQTAYDLITRWEGFRAEWYEDVAGVETIGFGFTRALLEEINLAGIKGPITRAEGRELLRAAVQQHYSPKMAHSLDVQLEQCDIDALTSFVYNVGLSAFETSTLLELYNEGREEAAEQEYLKWVYATDEETGEKRVVDGLVERRKDEQAVARRDEDRIEHIQATSAEPLRRMRVGSGPPVEERADTLA